MSSRVISYAVKVDEDSLADSIALFKFAGGNIDRAITVAINKTVPQAKTKAAKEISTLYNLKSSYIKSKLNLRKARATNLSGAVFAASRGTLLSRFEYGAKTSLVSGLVTPDVPIRVKVKKQKGGIRTVSGNNATYGKPFLFRLKNARAGGMSYGIGGWRKTPGPRGGRIEAFYSQSVSQIFERVKDEVTPEITEIYQKQIGLAMNYLLRKQYPS